MNLNIAAFAGMIPRRNRQKLPPSGAELAENCDLLSGDLRPLRGFQLASNVDMTGKRAAFRVPASLRGDIDLEFATPASELSELDVWFGFRGRFSHFLKGPLVNDKYNRWYWTEYVPGEEPQRMRYQNMRRHLAGEPALVVGVPRPVDEQKLKVTPDTVPVVLPFASYPGTLTLGPGQIREDIPFVRSILVEGGTVPYTFEIVAGAMPNGLEFDTKTGIISGTPTTPGAASVSIKVSDSASPTPNEVTHVFNFDIGATQITGGDFEDIQVYAIPVPPLRRNDAWVTAIPVEGGGKWEGGQLVKSPYYTFDILEGTLPQGLSLNPETGVISGIPTIVGRSDNIKFEVRDQFDNSATFVGSVVIEEDPLTELGESDLIVTRCYVYTFVTAAGEEGPPSEPVCAEGADEDGWMLENIQTAPMAPWDTEALITKKRIYRTVTGQTGGSFFFVDEIALDVDSYHDEVSTDDVSLNQQLESDSWEPPPKGLIGIVRHPNGFLVGFVPPYDIYFSEPYRPHAWPPQYVLSTEGEIMALGVFGQSIGVPTTAHPYVLSGSHPANMSFQKSNTSEPCVSRESVVSTEAGVVYASDNGLVLLSPAGVDIITKQLVTRGEWNTRYKPSQLDGTQFGFQYIGVALEGQGSGLPQQGFIFSPTEQNAIFTEIAMALQRDMVSLQTDIWSGEVYTIANGKVYWWADYRARPEVYRWRTLEFVTPKPVNFGAYRIDFDPFVPTVEQAPETDAFLAWNEERLAWGPIDPLDFRPLDTPRVIDDSGFVSGSLPQNRAAVGGSVLFDVGLLGAAYVEVLLYADSELKYRKLLTRPGRYRLPLGYKADLWQLEFRGIADLHHFKMAETGKELAAI